MSTNQSTFDLSNGETSMRASTRSVRVVKTFKRNEFESTPLLSYYIYYQQK